VSRVLHPARHNRSFWKSVFTGNHFSFTCSGTDSWTQNKPKKIYAKKKPKTINIYHMLRLCMVSY